MNELSAYARENWGWTKQDAANARRLATAQLNPLLAKMDAETSEPLCVPDDGRWYPVAERAWTMLDAAIEAGRSWLLERESRIMAGAW